MEFNFHRMLYVFACRTKTCYVPNNSNNLTVLRSQLPLINAYYSAEAPCEIGEPLVSNCNLIVIWLNGLLTLVDMQPPVPLVKCKLCLACGCVGHLKCSRCKKANYCSVQHQKLHWKYHKTLCQEDNSSETSVLNTCNTEVIEEIEFPEWEIVIEAAKSKDKDATEANNDENPKNNEYRKYLQLSKDCELQNLSATEIEQYTESAEKTEDKFFHKFRKICADEPDQIIRYDRLGQPLWIDNIQSTVAEQLNEIPPCEQCGTLRQFEFQIMPQMLNYLKDPNIDWGVLVIYTCPNSCPLPDDIGYVNEFIIKQDITH